MTRVEVLREWFGISPAASRVLDALYDAGGKVVPREQLRRAGRLTGHGLDRVVKELRHAMDAGSLGNARGVGFRLNPIGLKDCDRGIGDATQRSVAA